MSVFHDEVEIEDFEYDEDEETYYYPCPCGDRLGLTWLDNGYSTLKVFFKIGLCDNAYLHLRLMIIIDIWWELEIQIGHSWICLTCVFVE